MRKRVVIKGALTEFINDVSWSYNFPSFQVRIFRHDEFFGDADDNDEVDEADDGTFFGGREYDGIDRLKQSELDIEYLSDGEVMHDTATGKVVFDGDTNASH